MLVTGVHGEATDDDLVDKYAEFGPIKNLHLPLDRRSGFVKGYALIEYAAFREAKNAIDATSGSELLGARIAANFAFVKGLPSHLLTSLKVLLTRSKRSQRQRTPQDKSHTTQVLLHSHRPILSLCCH